MRVLIINKAASYDFKQLQAMTNTSSFSYFPNTNAVNLFAAENTQLNIW